ncbi:anaerobic sulfatase-maturating enzyme [Methanobrevibacter filiformis]|uniref:Anaerobic sulfatase-maturating enzyme n=1 Tax=Methanobrevibacter filiformis TaxID=55758 RepID=A0A166CI41_9EURY|nr:radical SAM protein [Methanobrevibacter filiformis]KZX14531.1 anaerobic sulfatase-maturating enzyme [Methanobrevibacter filiformis]
MTFHIMIIPTLSCPSKCSYCWGSEENAEIMKIDVVKNTLKWLENFRDEPVHFTFHGGEPLLAGYEFYKESLPLIKNNIGCAIINFSVDG